MSQVYRIEVASQDTQLLFTTTVECKDVEEARELAQKVAIEFGSITAVYDTYSMYVGSRSPNLT